MRRRACCCPAPESLETLVVLGNPSLVSSEKLSPVVDIGVLATSTTRMSWGCVRLKRTVCERCGYERVPDCCFDAGPGVLVWLSEATKLIHS